jgi:hypothetical protein
MKEKGARARRLVEDVFATHDGEIQCVAAQTLMASCVVELLTDGQSRQRYPALWTHFRFCSNCAEDYQVLMAVARQEGDAGSQITPVPRRPETPGGDWVEGLGYLWQRLADTHQVLVRLWGEAPSTPTFAPAVKGRASDEPDVVRHLTLTPDDSGDLDLKIVVRRSQEAPGFYALTVRAQFRSRWQTLAGTTVVITADGWEAERTTDEHGEVVFEGIPEESLAALAIQIRA